MWVCNVCPPVWTGVQASEAAVFTDRNPLDEIITVVRIEIRDAIGTIDVGLYFSYSLAVWPLLTARL